jgi:hypothetical protein
VKKELKYSILVVIGTLVLYYLVKLIIYGKERMDSPFTYFSWSEFDSPDAKGSGQEMMDEAFIHKLDGIRAEAGFPFIITSGYRTPEHNAKVGGVANSSHIKGFAADIAAVTTSQKTAIAEAAIRHGVTRIGWGNSFIHLDIDPSKTQNVVWGYGNNPPTFSEIAQNLA